MLLNIFGNKSDKPTTTDPRKAREANHSMLAEGAYIIGDIESEGNIRIDGIMRGNLVCHARLVIGRKGKIEGTVDTVEAVIEGEVIGELYVRDLLTLAESAKIVGDICTVRFSVQDGAVFTGKSIMGNEAKEIIQKRTTPSLSPNKGKDNNRLTGKEQAKLPANS
jgi:cytoskeletal protein CcmA (bactofilin family)